MSKETNLPTYGKIRLVSKITTFSAATIWRKVKDPTSGFPKPFKIAANTTLWDLNEVVDWVESQKSLRA